MDTLDTNFDAMLQPRTDVNMFASYILDHERVKILNCYKGAMSNESKEPPIITISHVSYMACEM